LGTSDGHGPGGEDGSFPIFIDKVKYDVVGEEITGAALRALPTPAIGPERDLYLVVPGGEDDLIDDTESVSIKPGTKFMTVPRLITPGQR